MPRTLRRLIRVLTVAAIAVGPVLGAAPALAAVDPTPQDPTAILSGFSDWWTADPNGADHFAGTVSSDPAEAGVLQWSDQTVTWINNHATAAQQFNALQTSLYGSSPASFDESIALARALGSNLESLYVAGRQTGALPLTDALLSSTGGSSGDDVHVSEAKDTYNYPRPFLATDLTDPPAGEPCATADNSSSLLGIRTGRPYADHGNLDIERVNPQVDTSHEFTAGEPTLDPGYAGLCTAGSFPSGHTTSAYEAGITLATLLPELAPEILTRASEEGNNRMVLGVHYPLDIMGGRIGAEAGIAAQWSDPTYRSSILEPARQELVTYLTQQCGTPTIAACVAKPGNVDYSDDPYGGQTIPGGSAQIVTDRASAVAVYTERLSYGFPDPNPTGLAAAVPDGAENLLLTTFPTLTDAQLSSVLAQTEIASGGPLDETDSGNGSWQRLDLAAAMSATVRVNADGSVSVLNTGGQAQVVAAPTTTITVSAPTTSPTVTATTTRTTTSRTSTRPTVTSADSRTPTSSAVVVPTTRTTRTTVTAGPTSTSATAPGLASTGADPWPLTGIGLLGVMFGGTIVILTRRRTGRP